MVERSQDATAVLAAAALGITGILMATGGLLHPHVPAARAAQMEVLAGNDRWLASHWTLTLGQPLAIVGLLLLVERITSEARPPALQAGAALAGMGFGIGTLGTLTAATALPAAAETGSPSLYGTVNAFALGLGWVCLALASAGGILFGGHLASLSSGAGARRLGWVVLAVSIPLLVALVFFSPSDPWTHDILLRASAVLAGLLFVAIGAWLGLASGEASLDQATLEDA